MTIRMCMALIGVVLAALSVRSCRAENSRPTKNLRSLTTVTSQISCIYYKVDILRELEGETALPPLSEHQCDLSEATVNAQGKIVRRISLLNLNSLPYDVFEGLESGRTLLTFADAVIDNQVLDITSDLVVSAQTVDNLGTSTVNQDNLFQDRTENGIDAGLRRLQTTDARTILVCRVKSDVQTSPTVSDETSADALALSDSFFGTNGKSLNLQSQMDSCSYGKQTFSPFLDPSLPADGVIQINVTTGPTYPEAVADLVDLIEVEIYNKFENTSLSNAYNLSLPFDHIMICLPKGAVSFNLAAADQNGPFSIYKDDVCLYPSVLQHELGHNLGLEHSGHMHNDTAYDFYGDISGAMGSSNARENFPRMCFNGANSWQLNWYQEKHATFEPLEDPIWTGDLVGVAEFGEPSSDELFVILKIGGDIDDGVNPTAPTTTTATTTTLAATTTTTPDVCLILNDPCNPSNDRCCSGCFCRDIGPTLGYLCDRINSTCPQRFNRRLAISNPLDYYVAFNRKVGFNNETKEGGDQVMVTSRGVGADLPTKLHAILSAGMSFPIPNFGGTGNTVTIAVLSIDLASVPARATVEITSDVAFPTESPAPSLSPSDVPSSMPSSGPTVFECDEDADCGVMLACSSSHQYCDAVTLKCLPVPGQCDCSGSCDAGESENSCPSDCVQNDSSLETTFAGGPSGQAGNMWDIETFKEIQVLSFAVHTSEKVGTYFRLLVYTKVGTYVGFETDPSAWTLIQNRTARSEGTGNPSPVDPINSKPLVIPAGQRQAFYVTQIYQKMEYTDGTAVSAPYANNSDLVIYEGAGKQYDASKGGFGLGTYQPVVWNGIMTYVVVPPIPAPVDPTPSPVDPTPAPVDLSSCPSGEVEVTIDILTDNYPAETTYEVKQGETMVDTGGPFDETATWYSAKVCLPSATTYTFTMNDSYGDGICCGYGNGEYTVTMGGEVVASGGEFGSSDTNQFTTQTLAPVDPTPAPVEAWNEIWFDDFESGWGHYNDGGADATRANADKSTTDARYIAFINGGKRSVRIRDNSSTSVVTSDIFGEWVYSEYRVTFDFVFRSMDNSNEDFMLEVSPDGSSWTTIKSWARSSEFQNDTPYLAQTVTFTRADVSSSTEAVYRFRCDASSNGDLVYIDNVKFEGKN